MYSTNPRNSEVRPRVCCNGRVPISIRALTFALWVCFVMYIWDFCNQVITSSEKSYRVGFVWVWSRKFDKKEALAHCPATQYKKKSGRVWEIDYVPVLMPVTVLNFLVPKKENIAKCHRKTLPFLTFFHSFHSVQYYKWFTNPYTTNQCTFLLLSISF